MAAALFYLPFPVAFTSNGLPAAGARLFFYLTGTLTPTDVFTASDMNTAHPNPVVANSAGRFAAIYLNGLITYRVIVKDKAGVTLDDIDPLVPGTAGARGSVGPPGDVTSSATRAIMAAIVSPALGDVRYLKEAGRGGTFRFDSSNLSALVAIDTLQGIYIAPAAAPTGASGAWVREISGEINVKWFGAIADDATNASPAINAAFAVAEARGFAVDYGLATSPTYAPIGKYYCATALVPQQTTIFYGDGGQSTGGSSTVLRFPAGQHGIDLQYDIGIRAPGIVIKGLHLKGGFAGTEGEFHGVNANVHFKAENVYVSGFQGDGFNITASSDIANGYAENANCFAMIDCTADSCRNGFYAQGADANAGYTTGFNAIYNRAWGINEASFLGNSHSYAHASGNGTSYAAAPYTVVHYFSRLFSVREGQLVGAATNAPPTTQTDNTWWLYVANGGASTFIPTWVSSISLRYGGAYYSPGINNASVFTGCYSEGDQGISQVTAPTIVMGGLHAAGVRRHSPYLSSFQGWLRSNGALMAGDEKGSGQPNILYGPWTEITQGPGVVQDAQLIMVTGSSYNSIEFKDSSRGTDGYIYSYSGNDMFINHKSAISFQVLGTTRGRLSTTGLDLSAGLAYYVNAVKVVGAQGAAVADPAAITSVAATVAVAAPTKAEFDALVAEFNKVRTDLAAVRTTLATVQARLRAATGHWLIA